MRARDLGLKVGVLPTGPTNSLTDVEGVCVGQVTLVAGHGELVPGRGPVRTGLTVVLPHRGDPWREPVFAGFHSLNGCGEVTGVHWIAESGMLMSPIALTSTHAVGAVHEGLLRWALSSRTRSEWGTGLLPVVAETSDALLNDAFGFHVRPEHVRAAIDAASDAPVEEGNTGGGTGMVCHGFKGGTGSASRTVSTSADHAWTVGVLVQANHGTRARLTIQGVPVGQLLPWETYPVPQVPEGLGSIIGVIATDAPLLPGQCQRLAARAPIGVARTGGLGEHGSGDMFIAFSTASRGLAVGYADDGREFEELAPLSNAHVNALFEATAEATEEAIVNALLAAETMTGRDGIVAHALPHAELLEVLGG